MTTLWTIGHSTRSAADFIELLQAHGVEHVVDVRRHPGSRRHPHFAREALAAALAELGMGYTHEPDLGGRRSARPDSPHTAWRNASFRGYADHMDTSTFRSAVSRLLERAEDARVAVMCAEAVPWRCHRWLLADTLVARGHQVRHILTDQRADAHKLHPEARVRPDGGLLYAGDQLSVFARDPQRGGDDR